MLGRKKKHRRIEIERMADRKRGRAPERTVEQIMMTRRTFVFKGLAAASFAALTGRLWQLQIRDAEKLKLQGEGFAMRQFPLRAARGLIYDRQGQLLADNKKSWSVMIIPAGLPNAKTGAAEREAIFATLARTLGMNDIATIRPAGLPAEEVEREEIYTRLAAALDVPVKQVRAPIQKELARERKVRSAAVAVSDELPPERAAAVRAAARDLPGVHVVNPIKHLVEVNGVYDQYFLPQLIKEGVPKEVALGIEANRLYLPGVQIDDEALGRQYLVGEEMGHILGYTGSISDEQWQAAVERDERGQPVLDADGEPKRIYADKDHVGKTGVEAALEATLRGQPGTYLVQVNAAGKVTREYTQYRRNPANGHSVVLTISTDFQREILALLGAGIERGNEENASFNEAARRAGKKQRPLPPGAGAAVALDPRTGEVLALASLPGYDPRHFAAGISQRQFDIYNEVGVPPERQRIPLMNRCLENAFPPGSTLKTFVAAAGLQDGKIKPDTKFKCLGHIAVPNTWNELLRNNYWCYTRDARHQEQDVRHALATSCDVFFYTLSAPKQQDERGVDLHFYLPDRPEPQPFDGLGIERINNYLHQFGFGERTGVELANEDTGLVPGPEWKTKVIGDNWAVGDTINTSIGQGYDLVTPLQLCNAMAAVANGGTLYRPTIVHQVLDEQGRVVREVTPTPIRKLAIDRAHLNVVREGLQMSITDPTGLVNPAQSPPGFPLPPGVDAGVKTGTAEYGTEFDEDGRFLRAHSWCTAFAPFNNPEICVVAFIEGGFGSAVVAAPLASAMIRAYFARFHSLSG